MPTYQYECSVCGHSFDVLQSIIEPKLRRCPACGKDALTRLIGTGGGIIFKGSGFYETDYKRKPESAPRNPETCPGKRGESCHSCSAKTPTTE